MNSSYIINQKNKLNEIKVVIDNLIDVCKSFLCDQIDLVKNKKKMSINENKQKINMFLQQFESLINKKSVHQSDLGDTLFKSSKNVFPPFQRAGLSNGTEVVVVEKHALPAVTINLVMRAGRSSDTAATLGLAKLMTGVWEEGTSHRAGEQIADQLAAIGASLSIATDWDATTARLFSLKRHLSEAAGGLRRRAPQSEFSGNGTGAGEKHCLGSDGPGSR